MLEEYLYVAYLDARKHKRSKRSQVLFEMHLEENLFKLAAELRERKYRPSRSMCFIVNDSVKREIFAASFRDRVVHHLLFNYIHHVLENQFIYDSYSCRTGKGTSMGVKRIDHHIRACTQNYTRKAYVLKLDISGYFMNIDKSILYDQLMRMLDGRQYEEKELVDYLIRTIVFHDPTKGCYMKGSLSDWDGLPSNKSLFHSAQGCGLPIGNLTSQLFSNVYLSSLDSYITKELGIKHYGRYVDDFFLVHTDKEYLKSTIPMIEKYLRDTLNLMLHPCKRRLNYANMGVEFVGSFIKPYRIYPSRRIVKSMDNHFRTIPDDQSPFCIQAVINSYFGYLSHFSSFGFRRRFVKSHPWLYQYGSFPVSYSKLLITDFGKHL